jgi:hypothetical protein
LLFPWGAVFLGSAQSNGLVAARTAIDRMRGKEAKVTRIQFDSDEAIALTTIERYPELTSPSPRLGSRNKPLVNDLPPDLQEALRIWLAGNQA